MNGEIKELVILVGIQGSGKSTFCLSKFSQGYVRINLDTLKTRNREWQLFTECLETGKSMVIDNTNPTKEARQRYIPKAKEFGYRVICYRMKCNVKTCLERNASRPGKENIPVAGVLGTLKKLERPEFSEGIDEIYVVDTSDMEYRIHAVRNTEEQ